jgi:hypothetical protein
MCSRPKYIRLEWRHVKKCMFWSRGDLSLCQDLYILSTKSVRRQDTRIHTVKVKPLLVSNRQ